MGIKDRFAESYAKTKTMTGPEKRANEIIGKLVLKRSILPIILIIAVIIIGNIYKVNGYVLLGINVVALIGMYFYIKNVMKKYQRFVPYVGNMISLDRKKKNDYVLLLKQGKKPVKLNITYGGEDFEKLKKNALIQVSYNSEAKIAILVKR